MAEEKANLDMASSNAAPPPYPTDGTAPPYPTDSTAPPYPTDGAAPPYPTEAPPYPTAGYSPYPPSGAYPTQAQGYPSAPKGMYPQQGAYPQEPAGAFPQSHYPRTGPVVVPQGPVVVGNTYGHMFRENPCQATCPKCQQHIVTQISFETGTVTWIAAGITCFFGGCLGCCLIPFCINGLKDVVHTCPNCNATLGRHTRM